MADETPKVQIKDMMNDILEEAEVYTADIAHVTKFVDSRNEVWSMGERVPNNDKWIIIGIFMGVRPLDDAMVGLDENDVRVYVAPLKEKDDKGKPVSFARFTLSRLSMSMVIETFLKLDVYKSEIARELSAVAVSMGLTQEPDEPEAEAETQSKSNGGSSEATPTPLRVPATI